jgi:hypothetical protein
VTERKVAVFLYGLFMDMDVLQQRGLAPSNPHVASLDGYAIEIRDRATVIPRTEARVYGIVTRLTHAKLTRCMLKPVCEIIVQKPLWSSWEMGVRCQPCVITCQRSRAHTAIPHTQSSSWSLRRPSRSLERISPHCSGLPRRRRRRIQGGKSSTMDDLYHILGVSEDDMVVDLRYCILYVLRKDLLDLREDWVSRSIMEQFQGNTHQNALRSITLRLLVMTVLLSISTSWTQTWRSSRLPMTSLTS